MKSTSIEEITRVVKERGKEHLLPIEFAHYRQQLRDLGIEFPQVETEFYKYLIEVRNLYGGGHIYEPDEPQPPLVYVEIGTRNGGSLYMTGSQLPYHSTIVSIDLEGKSWGRSGTSANKQKIAWHLQSGWHHDVHIIEANSQDAATAAQLREILGNRTIDLLFIDGDHTFGGVLRDWELYHGLVRTNGLIAFHDILENPKQPRIKVHLLWRVLKTLFDYKEFTDHPQGAMGIGVIGYNNSLPMYPVFEN